MYTVFILELISILMTISDMFKWFGSGYGNLIELGNIQLSGVDTPMLGAFIAAAVQMFYCYRIYTINKKAWWVSVFVALVRAFLYLYLEAITSDIASAGINSDCCRPLRCCRCMQSHLLLIHYSFLNIPTGGRSENVCSSRGKEQTRCICESFSNLSIVDLE